MKARVIISLLVLSWVLTVALVFMHKGRVQLVKLPPASLAAWYKPQSERHVWLHNMFNLRREMQAVRYYAETRQATQLAEWNNSLREHYQKIAEMVPEWKSQLDFNALDALLKAQLAGQFEAIVPQLKQLQKSCDSCHEQYRAITAALYRAPDFSNLALTADGAHLDESMRTSNEQVNRIKIAIQAQDKQRATAALGELKTGIQELGNLCVNCHEHLPKEYPDGAIDAASDDLAAQLVSGSVKQQNRALGMLAVTACAQCHGTHRIAYDTRKLLSKKPGLLELLKH